MKKKKQCLILAGKIFQTHAPSGPPNSCATTPSSKSTCQVLGLCRAKGANSWSLCQTVRKLPDADSDPVGIMFKTLNSVHFYFGNKTTHSFPLFLHNIAFERILTIQNKNHKMIVLIEIMLAILQLPDHKNLIIFRKLDLILSNIIIYQTFSGKRYSTQQLNLRTCKQYKRLSYWTIFSSVVIRECSHTGQTSGLDRCSFYGTNRKCQN